MMDTTLGSMTEPQNKKLHTLLADNEFIDHVALEEMLGFSTKELSKQDASELIDALMNGKDIDGVTATISDRHSNQGKLGTDEPPNTSDEQIRQHYEGTPKQPPARQESNVSVPAPVHEEPIGLIQIGDMEISESVITSLKKIPGMLNSIFRNIMQKGTDYDTLPGTNKPTLLKPGAEMLRMAFNLSYQAELETVMEDWDKGVFYYKVFTHFSNSKGQYVGTGIGSANSGETRYAIRWVYESDVPKDVDKATLKSRTKQGRNGPYTQYAMPLSIDEKATLINTLQKMAKKRSFVDGILSITGASRIFTQDVEDMQE